MKNLLKLGQGPRPDLLFEEEEKAKKSDTQPDGQKKKIEFEKGLRTVRKEAEKTNWQLFWHSVNFCFRLQSE